MRPVKHFHVTVDDNLIAWVCFDQIGHRVNTFNPDTLTQLDAVITQAEQHTNWQGMVLYSGKSNGFIAGADIEQFTQLDSQGEANELVTRVHQLFNRITQLPMTTVAMISGFCLGGGVELALACDYRVLEAQARLGLPEVNLGIKPGWGGSVRLTRLVGVLASMDMMLTGRLVEAKKAQRMGLVDAMVPDRLLKDAAGQFAMREKPKRSLSIGLKLLERPGLRHLLGWKLRHSVAKKVNKAHYPAPYAIIADWVATGSRSDQAMRREIQTVCELLMTETSRHLVRVFFLKEALKKASKTLEKSHYHVHVVGAGGVMGGDIAAWCAYKGCTVTIQDQKPEDLEKTLARAVKLFNKKLKDPMQVRLAMDRLIPDTSGKAMAKADIVIEAVFEALTVKQDVLTFIEKIVGKNTLIATNTSSLPLDEINKSMKDPGRLIGVHFFNPVSKMQLVEVVSGEHSREACLKQGMAFVGKIGRLPLPVKSSPGFLVNRVLMPYMMQAIQLMDNGVGPERIDQVAKQFGMPMGPIELADTVGLDICLSVAEVLIKHFGGKISQSLRNQVNAGHLGRKTGQGFYHYHKDKRQTGNDSAGRLTNQHIEDCLLRAMSNEAQKCLDEGVVSDADALDAGMIFGAGFAPFRGGLMQWHREKN